MNGSCDVLDYLHLGTNLFRNLNPGETGNSAHRLPRELTQSDPPKAFKSIRAHPAECQRAIRQAIVTASRALKQAQQHPADLDGFALALDLCKLPFSADMCGERQDQIHLQLLDEELASLKAKLIAKLGAEKYEELRKTLKAVHTFEQLDRFIEMRKCLDEFQATDQRLTEELGGLREERARAAKRFYHPASWKAAKQLDISLQQKESEIQAHHQKGPFAEMALQGQGDAPGKQGPECVCENAHAMARVRLDLSGSNDKLDRVFQKLSLRFDPRQKLAIEFRELAAQFADCSYHQAVEHRTDLLQAVLSGHPLGSVSAAQPFPKNVADPDQSQAKSQTSRLGAQPVAAG